MMAAMTTATTAFEPLEPRRLLAASATPTLIGTTLTINGTGHADRIILEINPDDPNILNVNLNSKLYTFPFLAIDHAAITSRGGNDIISLSENFGPLPFNATIDAGSGNDGIITASGGDTVRGGAGKDTITGGDGDDLLDGGAGNDLIFAGNGTDHLIGGPGNDDLRGEAGNDLIEDKAGKNVMSGGAGDDHLTGGSGKDTMSGDDGDDTLDAGPGNDTLDGGPGNDYLLGGPGKDTINGGDGDDDIWGGSASDIIRGGPGNDDFDKRDAKGEDKDLGPDDVNLNSNPSNDQHQQRHAAPLALGARSKRGQSEAPPRIASVSWARH